MAKKKVPFDYEYFKAHPETELVDRRGKKAFFIGENKFGKDSSKLVFGDEDGATSTNSLSGEFREGAEKPYDVFMLIDAPEPKVEEWFLNIYPNVQNATAQTSIEKCISFGCNHNAISVFKLVIVDGIVDKEQSETVHIY